MLTKGFSSVFSLAISSRILQLAYMQPTSFQPTPIVALARDISRPIEITLVNFSHVRNGGRGTADYLTDFISLNAVFHSLVHALLKVGITTNRFVSAELANFEASGAGLRTSH